MPTPRQLEVVYERLLPLLTEHEPRLVVVEDEPGSYALGARRLREDG